jgi:hypothetical protein
MGLSVSGLVWAEIVPATAAALFGVGLGWKCLVRRGHR